MAATAPDFIAGGVWFNSPPLTIKALQGKVVLIDFWTYTCINCIRTFPYLKSWYSKYEKNGFVIVGVHTPEFAFEKDSNNVRDAISDFEIKYPVMQDNDYATWSAYRNRYWPAHYLLDKNGKIRYTHFGEGEYDKTEEMIQKLLKEAGADIKDKISNQTYEIESRTPETYLGYARMQGLASPENPSRDTKSTYTIPKTLASNSFAFGGNWTINEEMATGEEGSVIEYKFSAKNVYLVMNPIGSTAKATIFLDGKQISSNDGGKDVIDGTTAVDSNRLYELVKLQTPGEHTLRIKIVEGKVSAFAFTFG
jgi:thiol-disulfide isomerase/thioredoxin